MVRQCCELRKRDEWLTVNKNGTVVTSSRMKWKDKICCHMLPCRNIGVTCDGLSIDIWHSPYNSDTLLEEPRLVKSLLRESAQPTVLADDRPKGLRPS